MFRVWFKTKCLPERWRQQCCSQPCLGFSSNEECNAKPYPHPLPGVSTVLSQLRLLWQNATDWVASRQQTFISHSPGASGQGAKHGRVPMSSSSGLEMTLFSLGPPRTGSRDGGGSLISVLIRTLAPFLKAPPSWPNYLPKAPPPNALGIRISTYEFWGDTRIQPTTAPSSLSLHPPCSFTVFPASQTCWRFLFGSLHSLLPLQRTYIALYWHGLLFHGVVRSRLRCHLQETFTDCLLQ